MSEIEKAINKFYSSQSKDVNQTVDTIRKAFVQMIIADESVSNILNQQTKFKSFKTIRGQLWGILLSLGEFDCPDENILFSNLTVSKYNEMSNNLRKEIERVKGANKYLNDDEVSDFETWLFLFSGYVYSKTKEIFKQEIYTFGFLLIHNFNVPTAFQSFAHLLAPIEDSFLKLQQTARITDLCFYVYKVLTSADQDFLNYDKNTIIHLQYASLASLFTQCTPTESVEVLWDFMLLFGTQFCVYIQASWLIFYKDEIKSNTALCKNTTFPKKPELIIKKAIEIYKLTNKIDNTIFKDITEIIYDQKYAPGSPYKKATQKK